ncbi:hypothetical protein AB1Y20_002717 [Prymnesium parvum]|uniref:Uncharacterized protein n=1 Tax=Prymnesium parvum TaxID=97485 RepID=A0AB34JBZ4_PRYPA|mmetsp:Transcript_8602/g.21249  ORF Transcript_8602/g.21249 Transcript_8602/m.21249 type:complete len:226 (+) Transcript_8602:129-806(+)
MLRVLTAFARTALVLSAAPPDPNAALAAIAHAWNSASSRASQAGSMAAALHPPPSAPSPPLLPLPPNSPAYRPPDVPIAIGIVSLVFSSLIFFAAVAWMGWRLGVELPDCHCAECLSFLTAPRTTGTVSRPDGWRQTADSREVSRAAGPGASMSELAPRPEGGVPRGAHDETTRQKNKAACGGGMSLLAHEVPPAGHHDRPAAPQPPPAGLAPPTVAPPADHQDV